jgi:hypothetical protein
LSVPGTADQPFDQEFEGQSLNPLEHLMKQADVPIEDRMAHFDARPSNEDLAVCLGYGLLGASGTSIKDDDNFMKVLPQQLPIKGIAIWMYFVLALMAVLIFFFQRFGNLPLAIHVVPWVMLTVGGLFVIPTMMNMFSWINKQTGASPYLVFDKSKHTVELPRLGLTLAQAAATEIVFLDRYVQKNRFWQVSLLVRDGNRWSYFHLFNEAGAGTGPKLFGGRELHEEIAAGLGIKSRKVKFSKRESESLKLRKT